MTTTDELCARLFLLRAVEYGRLAAEHVLIDARLRAGDGVELVAELSARALRHPLDERVAGQYLVALYRAGGGAKWSVYGDHYLI